MDRTADGNTPGPRETITDALREPMAPFTPEDLSITFTAAQDTLEAEEEEEDDEIAGMLRENGNIEHPVLNLNNLISPKGLNARHTTTLYTVDQMMQEAITLEPTGDTDVDTIMLVYNQNLRVMDETRTQLQESTNNAILESMLLVNPDRSRIRRDRVPEHDHGRPGPGRSGSGFKTPIHLGRVGRSDTPGVLQSASHHDETAGGTPRQPPLPEHIGEPQRQGIGAGCQ